MYKLYSEKWGKDRELKWIVTHQDHESIRSSWLFDTEEEAKEWLVTYKELNERKKR